jgi:hypothetical protein
MPPFTRLARIVRVGTLPETRRLIVAAARSDALRDLARRAVRDRPSLVRDLRNPAHPRDLPASARDLVMGTARNPAARELVNAGLLFLPGRYLPLGWAASWAARRILRRYGGPPRGRRP